MRPLVWSGTPAWLEPHRLFSTGDPVVAERLGSPFLGRHRLILEDPAHEARVSLHAVVIGAVTLAYLHLAVATEVQLSASADRFLVVQPTAGRTAVACGAITFWAEPDRAVVVQPGRPTALGCPGGSTHLVVGVERPALLGHVSRMAGRSLDGPLVFDAEMDLATAAASRWCTAVQVLQAELSAPGSLLRSGIGQGSLEEFLMSSLLYGHRSSSSDALRQPGTPGGSRAMAAATQFIDQHLTERLSVASVAAAVGVSGRTLQAAFRTELRITPTAYIRGRRLDRVRSDLQDAAMDTQTVTDIATRWGFTHLGRFATGYRDRFGETPSQTLHRYRRPPPQTYGEP